MKVYKFGGASVKNAEAVRNVGRIIERSKNEHLLVVTSAMGKTTNKLEALTKAYYSDSSEKKEIFKEIYTFHKEIISDLIADLPAVSFYEIDNLFVELECMLEVPVQDRDYDFLYDQIVSFGEIISTKIISHYLNSIGIQNRWIDARNFIATDSLYRSASVEWDRTNKLIGEKLGALVQRQPIITQGFIGKSENNNTTTLGREGSDYSAAIFAFGLKADSVTIWKDVPAVMNADPKRITTAEALPRISYAEAIELAYYGATVIHPKTIQPLKELGIPLHVKSFLNPDLPGTEIIESSHKEVEIPCYIFKENQVYFSISSKDYSFIIENHLSDIFAILSEFKASVSLMQNTAIQFQVCAQVAEEKKQPLMDRLQKEYQVEMTDGVELVTLFNYRENAESAVLKERRVLIEQNAGNTHQFLIG